MTDIGDLHRLASALERVIDPEAGMSIVDLGLVYGLGIEDGTVLVDLGVTTPGCPYAGQIVEDVAAAIQMATAGGVVDVVLAFDPPWSANMLSDRARELLRSRAFDTPTVPAFSCRAADELDERFLTDLVPRRG